MDIFSLHAGNCVNELLLNSAYFYNQWNLHHDDNLQCGLIFLELDFLES